MIWAYVYNGVSMDLKDIVLRPDVPENLYLIGSYLNPYNAAVGTWST